MQTRTPDTNAAFALGGDAVSYPDPALVVRDRCTPAWYATSTRSRHEKQVARVLQERNIECFLPLYEVHRRTTHRGHPVFLPLFSGYVFVHIALQHRLPVLQVPGVVSLVSFNGRPAAVQDSEVEALRNVLTRGLIVEPYPYLKVNREVEIRSGPLQGLRGTILRRKGHFRIVLSVDLLRQSVAVDVDAADVTCLYRCSTRC